MKTIKYGIIGVGNMGSGHLGILMRGEIENAVVTAVADKKEFKLDKVRENYPNNTLQFYSNGEELI